MKNYSNSNKMDFNKYAHNYEQLLSRQLAFFSRDRDYFSEYKVSLSARFKKTRTTTILDFGAGVGLSLPFLRKYYANAKIYATDLSEKSLEQIRSNYNYANVLFDHEIDRFSFDLIFVACVFHHVEIDNHSKLLIRLSKLLTNKGELHIFEHNPWNPITRRMVSTCPFDENAELIRKAELIRLIETSTSLQVTADGYCLFFPQTLSVFLCLEKLFRWVPMGGQYYIFAGI